MARPLRIQYPDAVDHVTCRGNEQRNIFQDDADRCRFLLLLNQTVNIYSVNLHSYVLMNNHFHLLGAEADGEAPAHRAIKGRVAKAAVLRGLARRSGKTLEQIGAEKGLLRRIAMDLLYPHGGMTNRQIGELFGVDYTAVSQERRRLLMLAEEDRQTAALLRSYEAMMSQVEK